MKIGIPACMVLGLAAGVGCSAIRGVAGDMGVPVKSIDRAGELSAESAAKNANLAPGAFVFASTVDGEPKTSFVLGEPIAGRFEQSASPEAWYQKFTGDVTPGNQGDVIPVLFIDGTEVWQGEKTLRNEQFKNADALPLQLWAGNDAKTPIGSYDASDYWQWSNADETLEEAFYMAVADKLPAGSHEIRIDLHSSEGFVKQAAPIGSGSFTLVVTETGRKKLAAQSTRAVPASVTPSEDKAIKKLVESMAKDAGARLYIVRSASTWAVERDAFQQPIRRKMGINVVFQKDSLCAWRQNVPLCQEHLGGGTYAEFRYCSTYDLFAGSAGAGIFTIPCGAASKLK